MGLIDLFRGDRMSAEALPEPSRDASDDRMFELGGRRSEINISVTVDRARKVPVVRDCLKILSDSVAGLQFGAWRKKDPRTRERLEGHPVVALLEDPNPRQTSFEFLAQVVDDLEAYGDFMARIRRNASGQIYRLDRFSPDPEITQVEELPNGMGKRFTTRDVNGIEIRLLEEEVWHIPLPPTYDGLRGRSPILHDGLEAVAVAIALQRYANTLFTNDATPPYALSMESSFKDSASKDNFLKAMSRALTGRNRHKPFVLEYGMTPHRMGLTAEEAQFLETRRELWVDLTRLWRVPPHKVGIMDKATFSNIEHQALEFVTDTLRPILELIERSATKFLIAEPGVYFEFNVASLLRGDIKTRFEAYALGRQWGWLSVNDVLRMENENGIGPAGDRYMEPLNMVPVGTPAGQRSPDKRASVEGAIHFLRQSVATTGGRPRLEIVKDAA
ncbi:MAG: phage portal protein [Rhodobacteraceae bacterium]|nr:phage portal protein [Paracoccaceae bacterium]MBR9823727.1 phage portal protein [Paracoccaceae bacterium]